MDQDIINGINTVLYYYEEYKNGNEEALVALEEIAKGINKTTKQRNKYYIIYSLLTIMEQVKVGIIDMSLYETDEYKELINLCKEDLSYYYSVSRWLEKYARACLKTDNYDGIDDVFMLSIKVSMILSNISEYFKHLNNILSYASSSITYMYPNNVKRLSLTTKEEIESIINKVNEKDS